MRYISFMFSSSAVDLEDANLRLFQDNVQKTIGLFRCGANGLVRVNYAQTIAFYNKSLTLSNATSVSSVKWTKAEIAIDWEDAMIYTRIGSSPVASTEFHSETPIESANGVMLYNLKPGSPLNDTRHDLLLLKFGDLRRSPSPERSHRHLITSVQFVLVNHTFPNHVIEQSQTH